MKINYKLIDPDGGVNLAKKKARLGLCENISLKSPDEFPTEGYIDDLSDVLKNLKNKVKFWNKGNKVVK